MKYNIGSILGIIIATLFYQLNYAAQPTLKTLIADQNIMDAKSRNEHGTANQSTLNKKDVFTIPVSFRICSIAHAAYA